MMRGARSSLDEDAFGRVYDRRVVARIAPYFLARKRLVAILLIATLGYTASMIAIPWMIKVAIDDYITAGNYSGLAWIALLFIGNVILHGASAVAQDMALVLLGQRVLYRLREEMFSHLQRLSLSFFDKAEAGRIMSRVQGDVNQVQEFLGIATSTITNLLSLIGVVAAVLLLNLKLGLISMAALPLLVLLVAVWQPHAKKSFIRTRRAVSIINGEFNQNISGVRVVQGMNRQRRNLEAFQEKNRENYRANLSATLMSAGLVPPVDILTAMSIGMAIYFGAQMVSAGSLAVGALVAFILYIQSFFTPIRSLASEYTQLQRAMASGGRIFELLDTKPDVVDVPEAPEMPRLRGEIEFRNVSYAYGHGPDVLKHLNLHVKPGESVAIVGPTGAGKTTLVSILSRFYDVPRDRGAVLVDGYDVRDVTRRSLARQTSMVLQEPFLFSGTVRENIKYNHTEATDEEMVEAARAVGAHDFIVRLEGGYDTILHERGVDLSPGQRQLLSFARAIIADPRILILDEATASVDSHTELLVQSALKRLLEGRTAIIIAHRLSTIRGADKIVVLRDGEIVEVGKHHQLMDRGGLYARLYQMNYAAME